MKTLKYISIGLLLLVSISVTAQQGINYKALIKDNLGNLVANQSITIQFTIYKGDDFSKIKLKETHDPMTDANGIVIVNIGEGSIISGSLDNVEWEVEPQYLNVQIDTGGGLVDMGTTQFKTVPYALSSQKALTADHALTADNAVIAESVSVSTYNVNTFYAELGGYVIEINTDGTHGLVVAMQDQGSSSWYETNDLPNNASNHDANGAKFKDWRLPTKRELNLMYINRASIGGFTSNFYWSSTEYDNSFAWTQDFANGDQYNFLKDFTFNGRAVRAF